MIFLSIVLDIFLYMGVKHSVRDYNQDRPRYLFIYKVDKDGILEVFEILIVNSKPKRKILELDLT